MCLQCGCNVCAISSRRWLLWAPFSISRSHAMLNPVRDARVGRRVDGRSRLLVFPTKKKEKKKRKSFSLFGTKKAKTKHKQRTNETGWLFCTAMNKYRDRDRERERGRDGYDGHEPVNGFNGQELQQLLNDNFEKYKARCTVYKDSVADKHRDGSRRSGSGEDTFIPVNSGNASSHKDILKELKKSISKNRFSASASASANANASPAVPASRK